MDAKHGVPYSSTVLKGGPYAAANALLNLATASLRDKLSADTATVTTNILHTAVQLVATAIKAQ